MTLAIPLVEAKAKLILLISLGLTKVCWKINKALNTKAPIQ